MEERTEDPTNLLESLLVEAGIERAAAYRPHQVQRILAISRNTFARLCDAWEPPDTPNRNPRGLRAYFVGSHRRVSHRALADWLAANSVYERLYG